MRKWTLGVLILPLVVLGLELLPYGAVLNFGRLAEDGSIGFFRETYSYFSLMPFGYGNFAPLLTAVLTCLLLLLLILFLFWKKRAIWKAAGVLAGVAAILSLLPRWEPPLQWGLCWKRGICFLQGRDCLSRRRLASELIW